MIMRRLLVLLLLVIAPVPVVASPAWACSCKAGGGIEDAQLAFDGTVRAVYEGGGQARVRFAVENVVKGPNQDEVTLTTSDDEASCGYRFEEGGRYRVYAVDGVTSLCSGNELLTASPSPSARAERQRRAAEDRAVIFWTGTGIVVLLVGAGMALLLRQPKPRD
ncbi:hypothetical protein [Actinoplanes sp. NPDC023714]|uniref:hypothetical protein n=1 Tax=Actinoplanes sp. NPDC023714 TaxID=3154322 RepID=UPI0033DE837D